MFLNSIICHKVTANIIQLVKLPGCWSVLNMHKLNKPMQINNCLSWGVLIVYLFLIRYANIVVKVSIIQIFYLRIIEYSCMWLIFSNKTLLYCGSVVGLYRYISYIYRLDRLDRYRSATRYQTPVNRSLAGTCLRR